MRVQSRLVRSGLLFLALTTTPGGTFRTIGLAQSSEPPSIISRTPTAGAVGVSTRTTVRASFNEQVQPASIDFELRNPANALVPATITYDLETSTATLTPTADLSGNTIYTATVRSATDFDGSSLPAPVSWSFTTATPQFIERIVFSGLTNPTAIEFAADGRVFVAEKSGIIKIFSSLTDTTSSIFADLRTNVHNFWDRGLLGLALHPQFPTVPYVYVLYAHDAAIGGVAPHWGSVDGTSDPCPSPPGPTSDGCVVSGRLSRLEANGDVMTGPETVLIEDWFQQYPSHSVGSLAFGPDGALYVSGGDGAAFNFTDYGQDGSPINPGGDPPAPVGGAQTPPTAEGGALRAQDLRTPGDPTSLDGAILRIDPLTGDAFPGNPLSASSDPNARRIIAYGLRNPFRMTVHPQTGEVFVGDVGWNTWEEINRIPNPGDAVVENFGWPCYEGSGRQSGYDGANLDICEGLYAQAGAVTAPLFAYNHSAKVVSTETCPTGTSSIAGLAFYRGSEYPASYDGALFFADYSRACIWVMFKGANGLPDPATRQTFKAGAAGPVQLKLGPDGNIYYVALNGSVRRFEYFPGNHPPTAAATATPASGTAPLDVVFDGSGSSDPDQADTLAYAWDFNADGVIDATTMSATHTFGADGNYASRLTVTDNDGLSDTAFVMVNVGSSAPDAVIDAPAFGTTWRVGDTIVFSGHASDPDEGTIAPSGLRWSVIMNHCSPLGGCHQHPIQDFVGVEGGSFVAPDHEYPSYLELHLTATDATGLEDTQSLRLDPQTVNLTFATSPAGLQLVHGSAAATAPFTRTVIIGSTNTMSAPSPQTLGSATHQFQSWSDGGARTHAIVAGATSSTYTATFVVAPSPVPAAPTGLTASRAGSTRIRLAWGNVANETGYRIERSVGGGAFAQVGTTAANVVSFTNTGLSANTIYTYRVRAFNASGNSAPSSTAQAKTLPAVIRINFQPAGVPVPSGYLVDAGAAYGSRGNGFSYGWNATNNQTRDRNSSQSPDQRFDTLNHMQMNGTFSWNLGLPNGRYQVRLVAGDAQYSANYFRIIVESVLAINQQQTSSSRWADRTVTVTVSDGRLTIRNATGSSGNKICFVDVTPLQ